MHVYMCGIGMHIGSVEVKVCAVEGEVMGKSHLFEALCLCGHREVSCIWYRC